MSDIKESIMKITSTIAKTSGEMLKTTKISFSLSAEEDKLKAIYTDIGKKVAEIYQYGGSLGKVFDEKYLEVVKQEDKIQKLRQQLETIKGVKTCPKCLAQMDKDAEFCSKCGYRASGAADLTGEDTVSAHKAPGLADEYMPEAETRQEHIEDKPVKVCRACGKQNDANDKFCLFCGRMM
ncbi:MAG: zinc ribbon domain-containing protein [Clostridiales bacterium]|nr:zinc ribbon domain-containing protein [Clostridiales bacterium]